MNFYPFIRQLESPVTDAQLTPLDERCRVVQFNSPLSDQDFRLLANFLKDYPTVPLRVYGHDTVEDLDFLKFFPFLEGFKVDVWEIKSLEGVSALPKSLKYLELGLTKSKAHSLKFLANFPHLQELYIEGHTKHFETISELKVLEKLTLRSVTLPNLEVLVPLKSLWWFALKLGGTKDLSSLPEVGELKYLEIWLVKGLSNLSPISEITSLQYLFLQALKQVKHLPSFKNLTNLRRLHLETMKALSDLTPILEATVLEELVVSNARHMLPKDFEALARHPSLKRAWIGLGSHKKNDMVKQILSSIDTRGHYSKFEFEYMRAFGNYKIAPASPSAER